MTTKNNFSDQIKYILLQMRENGLTYVDEMVDYFHGEYRGYFYDKETRQYKCEVADVIAASYRETVVISEEKLLEVLSSQALNDFSAQGFKLL